MFDLPPDLLVGEPQQDSEDEEVGHHSQAERLAVLLLRLTCPGQELSDVIGHLINRCLGAVHILDAAFDQLRDLDGLSALEFARRKGMADAFKDALEGGTSIVYGD